MNLEEPRKSLQSAAGWDSLYVRRDRIWSADHNPEIVALLERIKPGGRILDLGAGEGANAIFCAQTGFDVEAIDLSTVAVTRLERKALELKLSVLSRVGDMAQLDLGRGVNDGVILDMVLPFIPRAALGGLMTRIEESLKNDGLLYLRTFGMNDPDCRGAKGAGTVSAFSLSDLREMLCNFEIVRALESCWLDDSHGPPHYHETISVLAKVLPACPAMLKRCS